jgi:hypothetical protein
MAAAIAETGQVATATAAARRQARPMYCAPMKADHIKAPTKNTESGLSSWNTNARFIGTAFLIIAADGDKRRVL